MTDTLARYLGPAVSGSPVPQLSAREGGLQANKTEFNKIARRNRSGVKRLTFSDGEAVCWEIFTPGCAGPPGPSQRAVAGLVPAASGPGDQVAPCWQQRGARAGRLPWVSAGGSRCRPSSGEETDRERLSEKDYL